jgi:phosphoketolase
LNGYKIANPTVLARIADDDLRALLTGYGHEVHVVEGTDPRAVHEQLAETLDTAAARIREIQHDARTRARTTPPQLPRWPMIVLRTPKGWTGPKVVDGEPVEGTWRAHQVPLAGLATNPEHLAQLETWMKSYRPEELFDEHGAVRAVITALAPNGDRRMGANPHAKLTYRRANHDNFHVRGYKEEGTTTTPFDLVMLNDLDRFRLVVDVIDRVPGLANDAGDVRTLMLGLRDEARAWTRATGDDIPSVRDWKWPA